MTPSSKPIQAPMSSSSTANNNNNVTKSSNKSQQPFMTPTPGLGASAGYMPPHHMPPFMDPAFMYYHNPYGYPTPFHHQAYGLPTGPFGLPYGAHSISGGQDQDQLSVASFRYNDADTRSEKKLNLNNNNIRSLANNNNNINNSTIFKNESKDNNHSGLLMPDPNQQTTANSNDVLSQEPTNSITELAITKRDDLHRMTPQLHQKPHVRASFSLNGLVQIRANDPCEGQPALVDIINLTDFMEQYLNNIKNTEKTMNLIDDNDEDDTSSATEMKNQILANFKLMQDFPGPLIKEYSSKAQVIQFCQKNVKQCLSNSNVNLIDPQSHALLWDFLALLVRQNGNVDLKTDISSLLLTGIGAEPLQQQQQQQINLAVNKPIKQLSNSPSSSSLVGQQQDFVLVNNDSTALNNTIEQHQPIQIQQQTQIQKLTDEDIQLNKLRQLLGAGQKYDAIELAIKFNMWPHALFLASYSNVNTNALTSSTTTVASSQAQLTSQTDNKILTKVKTRFINSLQQNDPIQTCYQLLTGRIPSVANVSG
jgi:hypothetical protein